MSAMPLERKQLQSAGNSATERQIERSMPMPSGFVV
jgi:hypothetical protein